MAEHKTRPQNHAEEDHGQPGVGRQHPEGSGAAYKEPSKRGTAGGKEGGKKGTHREH
jgi:hypothetical protein